MKKILWSSVLVFMIVCFNNLSIYGGDDDIITIRDANLEAAIREQLEITNSSTPIRRSDMEGLWGVSVEEENPVASLEGLEAATNLRSISIKSGSLSDLTPLSGMANLRRIDITNCNISDLMPIKNIATNIEFSMSIILDGNNIRDLSPIRAMFSAQPKERLTLSLNDNNISSLQGLSGLYNDVSVRMDIYLENNNISSLQGLNNMTNLASLDLSNNPISNLQALENAMPLAFWI